MRLNSFLFAGIAVAALALATPSFAAGNAVGKVLQSLSPDSVGKFVSDGIYGNEPNTSSTGGVLPTFAPGPHVCGGPGCEGPSANGPTMGELIAPLVSGQATPNYTPTPHDFSAPHI
jgi:hypothetical protein